MTMNGTTVFRGGSVFDGHRHLPGHGVVRRRRPGACGACRRTGSTTPSAPAPPRSTSRAGCCCPASSTPTCTRSRAASSGSAATSPRRTPARTTSRIVGEYAAAHPELPWILGGGWAMAAFPGRYADRGRPRRRGPGPAGVPAQPRPPRRLGEQPGDGDRRHRPRQPRPRARPLRARRRRATRPAPCTRARWPWCPGTARPPRTTRTTAACSRASATCTRWASPPGRTPSSARTPAATTPPRRTSGPRPAGT